MSSKIMNPSEEQGKYLCGPHTHGLSAPSTTTGILGKEAKPLHRQKHSSSSLSAFIIYSIFWLEINGLATICCQEK